MKVCLALGKLKLSLEQIDPFYFLSRFQNCKTFACRKTNFQSNNFAMHKMVVLLGDKKEHQIHDFPKNWNFSN